MSWFTRLFAVTSRPSSQRNEEKTASPPPPAQPNQSVPSSVAHAPTNPDSSTTAPDVSAISGALSRLDSDLRQQKELGLPFSRFELGDDMGLPCIWWVFSGEGHDQFPSDRAAQLLSERLGSLGISISGPLSFTSATGYRAVMCSWPFKGKSSEPKRQDMKTPYDQARKLTQESLASYYGNWEKEERFSLFDQVCRESPKAAFAWLGRARCHLAQKKCEAAMEDINTSLELAPENADCWWLRGWIDWEMGAPERAVEDFTKALTFNPRHYDSHYQRGVCYFRLGRYDEAEKDMRICKEIDPGVLNPDDLLHDIQMAVR